jgi:hypothetical protein
MSRSVHLHRRGNWSLVHRHCDCHWGRKCGLWDTCGCTAVAWWKGSWDYYLHLRLSWPLLKHLPVLGPTEAELVQLAQP